MKLKGFCKAKEIVNRLNRQPMGMRVEDDKNGHWRKDYISTNGAGKTGCLYEEE